MGSVAGGALAIRAGSAAGKVAPLIRV